MSKVWTGAAGALSLGLVACGPSEATVWGAIDDANYCEVAEDCRRIDSKCPFDCNTYVNVAEAEELERLMESYQSDCDYKCPSAWPAACESGRCVADTGS